MKLLLGILLLFNVSGQEISSPTGGKKRIELPPSTNFPSFSPIPSLSSSLPSFPVPASTAKKDVKKQLRKANKKTLKEKVKTNRPKQQKKSKVEHRPDITYPTSIPPSRSPTFMSPKPSILSSESPSGSLTPSPSPETAAPVKALAPTYFPTSSKPEVLPSSSSSSSSSSLNVSSSELSSESSYESTSSGEASPPPSSLPLQYEKGTVTFLIAASNP
mmetsp:Transcript_7686/g.11160  ORF Transcript_7686/g.11160 Transcript_7686/m.11160 type:complete len:217 (-) Transcript_7686:178-828(-)|eukprot:CAMPEP_0194206790 /NCGR_PEP_ID=MMETSP0156-20130528/5729_1 /TAXON_ID=33649 /ORGANISM="Thalassionema nitzschioides, Strain L26-B" /LENGTH=216 /DNA_ID=CAMNT_0038933407 /DNA_START=20 /DNA_END=670 /DNA_ORIENTATION=+